MRVILGFHLSALAPILTLGLLVATASAQAAPAEFAPVVEGRVESQDGADQTTPTPVKGAIIEVFHNNNSVFQTRSDQSGAFRLSHLPILRQGPQAFIVTARSSDENSELVPTLAAISPGRAKLPLRLTLAPSLARSVRVMTPAGEPVEGAIVEVFRLWVTPPEGYPEVDLQWFGTPPQTSAPDGAVTLMGVPSGARIELKASKKEFADTMVLLPSSQEATTIQLAPETIIYGRVTLGGEEPLAVPEWRIKMQGWELPWSRNWRVGNLNNKGEYVIRNVTSPGIVGHATYPFNLDLANHFKASPDLSAAYVPPNAGYDVMVTTQRNGQTQRWITYVAGPERGLNFEPGSDVRQDIDFEPMALVVGTVPPGARADQRPAVSYRNPRSIYGAWHVTVDEKGRFEIPVPTGDLVLSVGGRTVKLIGLKPHEKRTLPPQTEPGAAKP